MIGRSELLMNTTCCVLRASKGSSRWRARALKARTA